MQTLQITTKIGKDGHIRLDVPTNLPQGEVELVVVISKLPGVEARTGRYDFRDLSGRLHWQGDAVAAQRAIRDEW